MPEQYIVQPVAKALQVLEYVAEEGRDLSLAMICEQTGLPKTTTFRYLQTLRRAGFVDVRCVDVSTTTVEEQRGTEWMRFQSLRDYLDPEDHSKTVEGLPAPRRAVIVGRKP